MRAQDFKVQSQDVTSSVGLFAKSNMTRVTHDNTEHPIESESEVSVFNTYFSDNSSSLSQLSDIDSSGNIDSISESSNE